MESLKKLLKALRETKGVQPISNNISFKHVESRPHLKYGTYSHSYEVNHDGKPVGHISLLEDRRAKSAGVNVEHNLSTPHDLQLSHAAHILKDHPIMRGPLAESFKNIPSLTDTDHKRIKDFQEQAGSQLLEHFKSNKRPNITQVSNGSSIHPMVQNILNQIKSNKIK
jgi:hypothetical protein